MPSLRTLWQYDIVYLALYKILNVSTEGFFLSRCTVQRYNAVESGVPQLSHIEYDTYSLALSLAEVSNKAGLNLKMNENEGKCVQK